jgi:hypothetical protein
VGEEAKAAAEADKAGEKKDEKGGK